ncbi:unnamed protein product [Durusdinium trenchii]|uniref:glucan 1,4-alpha-glucosidase n=1 Tax=Durusdinium trenchii TaxID=1381693 RepID=A0ABP0M6K8_9DINO
MLRATVTGALALTYASSETCFLRLEKPLEEPPFSQADEDGLLTHFGNNINLNGTGAVIASPGACPALVECCNIMDKQPYGFHWTRDASLSLLTYLEHSKQFLEVEEGEASLLQTHRGKKQNTMRDEIEHSIDAFAGWVEGVHARKMAANNMGGSTSAAEEAYLEPKWTFDGEPYKGGWCRPQTDGPPLRARLLMKAAKVFPNLKERLWPLAKKDLDWLVDNFAMNSCDLWEETRDDDFVWNRVVQLSALAEGADFTENPNDKQRYLDAIQQKGEPLANHIAGESGEEYITNCPASNMGEDCVRYDKQLDGVLILTLIHGHPMVATDAVKLPSFLDAKVANTVKQLCLVFCKSYPINTQDTDAKVPGVLLGRYELDHFGHQSQGNPWVLITASLANLLYKAAAEVSQGGKADPAWANVFQNSKGDWWHSGWTGSAKDFIAAGDGVLKRLRHHMKDGMHLYEQIDKHSGEQWNAKDLTWSYAEVLGAMQSRRKALKLCGGTSGSFTSLEDTDVVRRFVKLLDLLYDRRIKVVLSSAVPLEELFDAIRDEVKGDMSDLAWRTAQYSADGKAGLSPQAVGTLCEAIRASERAESRLREMRTRQYWQSCE